MRTRTPLFFFTANTAPFGGTPRVLGEEELSAAAYLQDEQWVAAIVLVGSSIDHKLC